MIIWIVFAVTLIVVLAFYAATLLFQLKKQTIAQKEAEQQRQQALEEHDAKILSSVALIVQALQEKQCDLSEGCWRLSVLLDSLKTSSGLAAKFPAIFGLYNKVKDMAILEERKSLEKKQRMREDYNRLKFEADYQQAIEQDLKVLAEFTDDQIVTIKMH